MPSDKKGTKAEKDAEYWMMKLAVPLISAWLGFFIGVLYAI